MSENKVAPPPYSERDSNSRDVPLLSSRDEPILKQLPISPSSLAIKQYYSKHNSSNVNTNIQDLFQNTSRVLILYSVLLCKSSLYMYSLLHGWLEDVGHVLSAM